MGTNNKGEKKLSTSLENKKKKVRLFLKIIWGFFAVGVLTVVSVFFLITVGVIGYMPEIEDLNNPIDKYASQIISADGVVLGTYSMAKNNRVYSKYSDLPQDMINALVATEDERFYEHSGVDAYSLIRAVVRTGVLRDKSGGGGSTISQQLAKQLYSPEAESTMARILQKPIEWVIASRLEKNYTKEEIINLYLNQFDFLYNAVGVQLAAQVYFNKPVNELTIEECATLVGMCKNPSLYNPVKRPEKTKDRRDVVLRQMLRSEFINQQQLDSLLTVPLQVTFSRMDHNVGLAPHFREYLRKIMNAQKPEKDKYFDKEQFLGDSVNWATNPLYGWINKNTKPDGSKYSLTADGLKIYTTIDSRIQTYAEEAVKEHLGGYLQALFDKEKEGSEFAPYARSVGKSRFDRLMEKGVKSTERYRVMKKNGSSEADIQKAFMTPVEMKVFSWQGERDTIMTPYDSIRYHKQFLRTGFIAAETLTGNVKAYVGDIDYSYFKYDMVNQSRRQVGSTFKPFLYTVSMQDGITPCDEMLHVEQVQYDENNRPWIPKNAGAKRVGETVTIKWGLQNSSNWVTAYLMGKTTPSTLMRFLRSFGVMGNIDPVISMCLGTDGIMVSEMAGAYTAFANKGIRSNLLYVSRIEDQHGNVISEFIPRQEEVFNETTYMRMLDMLKGVIDGGTGGRVRRIYKLEGEIGGKTGTSQENADGWFMAFTPTLSTATWVGGEERDIHFGRMEYGQGASSALPIFGLFMQKVYKNKDLPYSADDKFEVIEGVTICPNKKYGTEEENVQQSVIDPIFD